ncbi:MAG: hypothetical protein ABH885_00720 [Candidatus Omnitrophota bacterium]
MKNAEYLQNLEKSMLITLGNAGEIIRNFHAEMDKGLKGRKSSLRMLPTYVGLPSGREKGKFLALDLGGTNFRVLALELKGNRTTSRPVVNKFTLQPRHIKGTGRVLFDFIAKCIKHFMHSHGLVNCPVDIGFTFSFAVKQTDVARGVLLRWTKGFQATGVEGHDVVELLNDSLIREGVKIVTVAALANDTVGTLVAKNYEDHRCDMGVILGTGTNACYPEKPAMIKKYKSGRARFPEGMIINMEWGGFNRLVQTKYDMELDADTVNPGEQIFEKMISGMYLGEIARLIVKDLIRKRRVFAEDKTHRAAMRVFGKKWSLRTHHMSGIESDRSRRLAAVESVLKEIGVAGSTVDDRRALSRVCRLVSSRAACLSAAGIAAVLTWMDPALSRRHTVAVDGTVYEKYPGFKSGIRKTLAAIFGKKAANISLALAKDGSGKGAAIIAAVAAKQK